jgi:DNA-binding LacI/PurR family transcriptional regulator
LAITLKEIAHKTGFSISTVSRSLSKSKAISPETRKRIIQISKELDYIPNLRARGLVAKLPDALGVLISRTSEFAFSNPFYAEILKGIGKKAREFGQYLILSFQGEEDYDRMFKNGLAAGIIVATNRVDDPRLHAAWKAKVPMVLIPGFPFKQPIHSVDADSVNGALKVVNFLADLGHERIGLLTGTSNSKYSIERILGFRKGLQRNHLPFRKEWIYEFDFTQEGGYEAMAKLLSQPEVPTAVLMISDYSAMGALRAAKDKGYRIPEDLSIIGWGDVPFASMVDPPLTTIRVPYQRIGEEAAGMLLDVIHKKRIASKQMVLPVELIVRKSSGPPLTQREK